MKFLGPKEIVDSALVIDLDYNYMDDCFDGCYPLSCLMTCMLYGFIGLLFQLFDPESCWPGLKLHIKQQNWMMLRWVHSEFIP
jgi:hypothetical protein